jgi:hypothetical protein
MIRRPKDLLLKAIFKTRPQGTRWQGRPKFRWVDREDRDRDMREMEKTSLTGPNCKLVVAPDKKVSRRMNPVVSGVQIELSKETKYLGVVLDSKLLWNSHIKRVLLVEA